MSSNVDVGPLAGVFFMLIPLVAGDIATSG